MNKSLVLKKESVENKCGLLNGPVTRTTESIYMYAFKVTSVVCVLDYQAGEPCSIPGSCPTVD